MGKHGGLNKAGKVRKATKKVEKKKPTTRPVTGRAKLRAKYNKNVYFMKQTKKKNYNTQEVKK